MPKAISRWLLMLCLLADLARAAPSEEELFFKGTADVNEGQLHFLDLVPDKPLYHFRNRVTVSDSSLVDGWVDIQQCHENLDAVPSLQIVYGVGRIRNLEILSSQSVGRSWTEANSVQLQDLQRGASICIRAESKVLQPDEFDGGYILTSGPYMRRFLDGYYPMRATLIVQLDTQQLRFAGSQPEPQPGFTMRETAREISYDAYFEGILRTELRFSRLPLPLGTP
jgi:hypothetical protein